MDRLEFIIIKQLIPTKMFSMEDIFGYLTMNQEKNQSTDTKNNSSHIFNRDFEDQYDDQHYLEKEEIQAYLPTTAKLNGQFKEQEKESNQTGGVSNQVIQINGVLDQPHIKQSILYLKQSRQQIQRCKKGDRFETNNIGKHLKSLTNKLLFALQDAKILNKSEVVSVRQFKQSNGSKKDFQHLFRHRNLRQKFLEFCSMKNFVRQILTSSKMSFKSKIMMVKHLEKLRVVGYDGSPSWKE